jgi:hypothetical protein
MMKKILASAFLLAFSVAGSADAAKLAHKLMTKSGASNHVTALTGAVNSTVVGQTKNGSHFYVHSIGQENGKATFQIRMVNRKTGDIDHTSKDLLGTSRSLAALWEGRGGAKGGQGRDYSFSVKGGGLTNEGNIRLKITTPGFNGQRSKNVIAVVNKSGGVKRILDDAADGKAAQ